MPPFEAILLYCLRLDDAAISPLSLMTRRSSLSQRGSTAGCSLAPLRSPWLCAPFSCLLSRGEPPILTPLREDCYLLLADLFCVAFLEIFEFERFETLKATQNKSARSR